MAAGMIGVCCRRRGDNLPSWEDVVRLYKSNHIHAMRIYKPDLDALTALRRSDIVVILGVGDEVDDVRKLADSRSAADDWVKNYVKAYYRDVHIKYIAVGHKVLDKEPGIILRAMKNVYEALKSAGIGRDQVKVSTTVEMEWITNMDPPSGAVFREDLRKHLTEIAKFLAKNEAPLLANVWPYFAYTCAAGKIDLKYALFLQNSDDTEKRKTYPSLFEAMVDAIYAALEKAGAPKVRVVVSATGWPWRGAEGEATLQNAQSYVQNLIKRALNGTPMKPEPMEVYVFDIFNHDFGLFDSVSKKPKYEIDFPHN